jgi:hypothetical protein
MASRDRAGGWPRGRPLASVARRMHRAKSALLVLVTLWAVQAVVVLPVLWIGGAGSPTLIGAFAFAGVVATTIVGVPAGVAEVRRRRARVD